MSTATAEIEPGFAAIEADALTARPQRWSDVGDWGLVVISSVRVSHFMSPAGCQLLLGLL